MQLGGGKWQVLWGKQGARGRFGKGKLKRWPLAREEKITDHQAWGRNGVVGVLNKRTLSQGGMGGVH